jgi:glycosyltransferase involved in cell wall biosynthesis
VIIVVDGNQALYRHLVDAYDDDRVMVVQNGCGRGLSGARNTGLGAARADVVVFLDDDAIPGPSALEGVRRCFGDAGVTALGGAVHPVWAWGDGPRWFPPEFGWVVGCDYRGLPPDGAAIRNPIGAAMAVRRQALHDVGGFSERLGRIDAVPAGCEETMMGIALLERDPEARIIRATSFDVAHAVPRDRMTMSYFVRRCYHEGRSKAVLTRLCGRQSSLASERSYVTRTLPLGLWNARHRPSRMLSLVAGLAVTGVGYLVGLGTTMRPERDH